MKKPNLNKKRVLIILGIVSNEELDLIRGLPDDLPDRSHIVLTDYALAEFPIGQKFTKIFSVEDLEIAVDVNCEVFAVTIFRKPVDVIPEGHHTICVLSFPEDPPELFTSLPVFHTKLQRLERGKIRLVR